MQRMLMAMAALMLSACATAPVSRNTVMASARAGAALVVIQRDSSIMPVASLPVAIFVDGELAGSVENGRILHLYLDDGHRSIGVAPVGRAVPLKPQSEIDVEVGGESTPVLRVHYVAAGWGGLKIEPMRK